MGTFAITSPEGKRFEITTPDGTTQEEALEYAQQQFSQPKEEVAPVEQPKEEAPFAAQVGRGMMDVYQGAMQLAANVGTTINKYVDTVEDAADTIYTPGSLANKSAKALFGGFAHLVPEIDAKAYNEQVSQEMGLYNQNNPDFQMGRVLGNIATPLTLVPGGKAASFGGKILTGMATGTLFSMFQPVENADEYWAEKGEQALWGATIGGGIPVAGKVLGTVTNWIDEITKPMYKSGVARDVSKFLKEHITQNKDKIIKSIEKAMKSGDKRTVGQIIADTTKGTGDDFGGMLVRLEKDLARESDSLKSMYARQSAGRVKFIDSLAGQGDEFASAIKLREATGARNYAEAFKADVVPDIDLKKILNNKFAKTAMKEATDLAQAKGTKNSSEVIHYIKLGLDKQLAKTGDLALSKAEKKVVGEVKDNMVSWLENKNPLYKTARQQYQIDSLPINRMQVGQEIRNKLITSLEKESPSTFASVIRDSHKMLKKATGHPRYKALGDIFAPDEVSKLKNISSELASEAKTAKMAAGSKSIIGQIPSEVELSLPHILSRPIVITNHLLSRLGQDKSKEYKALLSSLMQNPDDFIRAYGGSSNNQKTKMAIDVARRINTMIGSQQAAIESGAE